MLPAPAGNAQIHIAANKKAWRQAMPSIVIFAAVPELIACGAASGTPEFHEQVDPNAKRQNDRQSLESFFAAFFRCLNLLEVVCYQRSANRKAGRQGSTPALKQG